MEITAVGKASQMVGKSHFGGNALWQMDHEIPEFTQKIASLGIGNLRWPGGSIAELFFDPANPDHPLTCGRTDEIKLDHDKILSFTQIMNLAASTGRSLDLVLPTRHLLGEPDDAGNRTIDMKAVADITEFVKAALQPDGDYADATIASFEIGNEYWGGGNMTAAEYGRVANVLVKAVQAGIDAAGSDQKPKILVQMGEAWGRDFEPGGAHYGKGLTWGQTLERANMDILDGLDATARAMIDGLIDHHYPRTGDELAYNGWNHEKKLSVWQNAGLDLPTHITEWNISSYGLRTGQDRFANGQGLLEAFEYLIRMGAGSAYVWPITQSTPTDLTGKPGVGANNLSVSGAVFKLLSENVRGMSWQNTNIEDIPEIESSLYVGGNRAVLFLTADEDKAFSQTLDLTSLVPGGWNADVSLRLSQMKVVRDRSMDQYVGTDQGAQILAGPMGTSPHVAVDLAPYETIMVVIERISPLPPPAPHYRIEGTRHAELLRGVEISEAILGGGGNDTIWGNGGNDTILGGEGDDFLYGGAGKDVLHGETGNDRLYGSAGADVLYGMAGNDRLFGGAGNDRLVGADGNDILDGGEGNDDLIGGSGDDSFAGDYGNDRLWGHDGNDALDGGHGNDTLRGGNGNDRIIDAQGHNIAYGDTGRDTIISGSGNDSLHGGSESDTILGGAGRDRIWGDGGDDVLNGGLGNDTIWGGNGNDRIVDLSSHNVIWGGKGNDGISTGSGNDTVYGGAGNDLLRGGFGQDRLHGQSGHDSLFGGHGSDFLAGEGGNDLIRGGKGNDVVVGGHGNDLLFGDAGNDTFLFGTNSHVLSGAGADTVTGGAGADTFVFAGLTGFTTIMDFQDGIDRVRFAGLEASSIADLTIRQDHSGDVLIGYAGGQIRLHDIDVSSLTASDFLF